MTTKRFYRLSAAMLGHTSDHTAVHEVEKLVVNNYEQFDGQSLPMGMFYSGKIGLRLSPELHAKVAGKAGKASLSMNQWLIEVIEKAVKSD